MKHRQAKGISILKSIWRANEAGRWIAHDLQSIDLRPREGFSSQYFKIKDELALLSPRPGQVMKNFFATFGSVEFLMRQSIVPVVAWRDSEKTIRCIGTGFFISASGLLLTAAHVVRDPIDENYASTVEIGKGKHRFDEGLHLGVLLPNNPAMKNAPFNISTEMRVAKWFFCPFEWTQCWGKEIESPLVHQKSDFKLDVDVAVCKVRQSAVVGPYQPLNVGLHDLTIGDQAIAIGYAEMKDIELGDGYEPELTVSVGSVTSLHLYNALKRTNLTPGPNFEFDAKIFGKMSGSPILVGGGAITKGVVSRSWQGENLASGCLVAAMMDVPIVEGKNLLQLQHGGNEGIVRIFGY